MLLHLAVVHQLRSAVPSLEMFRARRGWKPQARMMGKKGLEWDQARSAGRWPWLLVLRLYHCY